jgi:hypothetical protein
MILSHDWRFIHLKTHKTAGTSVELSLSALCGPLDIITPTWGKEEDLRLGRSPQNYIRGRAGKTRPDGMTKPDPSKDFFNHMPAALVRKYIGPRLWQSYCKVGFVRNPWDREVSWYLWRNRETGERSVEGFRRHVLSGPVQNEWGIISIDDEMSLDFVGRYETLDEDFAKLLKMLGYNGSVPLARAKVGSRSANERDYRRFYDGATRELVGRRQAKMVEAFGYTF